jgi:uracil-DNA glycosylase
MADHGAFPFGYKVKVLRQRDRSPKKIFVLGVYASAVHARWIGRDGKQRVAALAVSSEPCIFWKGDDADSIVAAIQIPAALGKLVPAGRRFNGPSGQSLDDRFLTPLGFSREDAWLCDIYPYAMVNPNQLEAIRRRYSPQVARFHLPQASLERAPTQSPGKARVRAILTEIRESGARTLILLGDRPIQWFLRAFHGENRRLSNFGRSTSEYGFLHPFDLDGYKVNVLPLVHPRQASRLGESSTVWGRVHDEWVQLKAPTLL